MAQALRIGQLARATGVGTKTIRYYEEVGVLPAPPRTGAGYRQYDQRSVGRLRFLRRARALGLSLQHLKVLAATLDGGPRPAMRPRLRALVRGQLSTVQRQIAELRLLQGQLERVLQRLRTSGRGNDGRECRCLEVESVPEPGAGRRARPP
jgi:MerR family copper efflux transcriptional regulator